MALAPRQHLAVNEDKLPQELPLSPEEFFVLSRIDGQPTVEQIIGLVGLDAGTTQKILDHLLELGALKVVARRPRAKTRGTAAGSSASMRRKEMLRAQLRDAKKHSSSTNGETAKPEPEQEAEPDSQPDESVVEPVDISDPRIARSCGIDVDYQRHLLALEDKLQSLTHFEILNIRPTTDEKTIRRAYHMASRKLHPDAHYGKDIGRFHILLQELFKRAKQAYETLMDKDKRLAYFERLMEPERQRERRRQEQEELLRAYNEEQQRIERERKEDERREQEAQAKQERRKRDEARRLRQRKTFAGRQRLSNPIEAKKAKAAKHAEDGRRLMKAGNMGAAANLFRLAKELDPGDPTHHELWQECIASARKERAEVAFAKAHKALEMGEVSDAAMFFAQAAEANPTPYYLSYAADSARHDDANRARALAMQCLDALNMAQALGQGPQGSDAAHLHLRLGRAFLAAGQHSSAKQQADIARKYAPNSPDVARLLDALKRA